MKTTMALTFHKMTANIFYQITKKWGQFDGLNNWSSQEVKTVTYICLKTRPNVFPLVLLIVYVY